MQVFRSDGGPSRNGALCSVPHERTAEGFIIQTEQVYCFLGLLDSS